jgi:phosphopantothenoylcysteine synthetase/decarboxylase
MTSLQGKKILITSGGTVEKWDEVRGHTNLAKGTMGTFLAEEALRNGAEVIYLHGYFAQTPAPHPQMRTESFMGIEDLSDKIETFVTGEHVDAVIMTAAISDWVVEKMLDQEGNLIGENGKISSDNPPVVYFKKAPKVITRIKNWAPETLLVGFKLEHTDDPDYLLQRAHVRMETWRADYTVANASASLHTSQTNHYIVSKAGDVEVCGSKQETAVALLKTLGERLA